MMEMSTGSGRVVALCTPHAYDGVSVDKAVALLLCEPEAVGVDAVDVAQVALGLPLGDASPWHSTCGCATTARGSYAATLDFGGTRR
jgi:hypothetical protein